MAQPSTRGSRARRLLALLWLAGCGAASASSEPAPPAEDAPVEVGVATLRSEPVALAAALVGRALVARGALLYALDDATYRAAHRQARAALASARAARAASEVRLRRHAQLIEVEAVSRQELDDARAAEAQATAAVAEARATAQRARIDVAYARITAPIAGRIGRSAVTPGALVTAHQAEPLAVIQQLDPIYVDLTQSSAELLRLKRMVARGDVEAIGEVRLRLEDGAEYPHPGRLQFTDVTVDPRTGSVTLRALFPNPDGALLPGMFVHATLDQAIDRGAILAPQRAVHRDERGNPIALVVDAQDRAALRSLVTDRAIGDRWLVLSGLAPGERIIVDGTDKVAPGAKVLPVQRTEAPPVTAAATRPEGG